MADKTPLELMEAAWSTRRASFDLDEPERAQAIASVLSDLQTAASELRGQDDPVAYAHALHLQAHVEWDRGRPERAEALWEDAVAVLREAGHALQLAHKVRHLGDVRVELDRVEDAAGHYEEALALYREHADAGSLDVANAVRRMAILKQRVGDSGAARDLWRAARDAYAGLGLTEGVEEADVHLSELG